MLALDEVKRRAEMVWAAEAAAGAEKPSDPDQAVQDFHTRLRSPLNTERMREAALKMLRSA